VTTSNLTYSFGPDSPNFGKPRPAPFQGRLAWVGVYRYSTQGELFNCGPAVRSHPPIPPFAYFAEIIDPDTAYEANWYEPIDGC